MARAKVGGELGFTLIELLIVIAIIMVLAGIMLAVGVQSRARARTASCANQMRQIGLALGMRADRGIPEGWAHRVERRSSHRPLLLCPEGPQGGMTNYAVNKHLVRGRAQVADTGRVVLLYESKRSGTIMIGDESDVDQRHLGGCNFVFLDGHTKWSKEIPEFRP